MHYYLLYVLFVATLAAPAFAELSSEATQVRLNCEMNERHANAYDCKCIAAEFEKEFAKGSAKPHPREAQKLFLQKDSPCLRPERIRSYALLNCATGFNYMSTQDHGKLGKEKFCHCIADEAVKRLPDTPPNQIPHLGAGNVPATVACGKMTDYQVPADSPFKPQTLPPIAALPSGSDVQASDDSLYLVILNKNFDLDRLDRVRYMISDDFQNDRNYIYATLTNNPVQEIPDALVKRGGADGVIEQRAIYDLVPSAHLNYRAILIKGSAIKELIADIQKNPDIKSVDYYVLAGDTIYRVPDLPSEL